jgi:hypothetical protein
MLNRMLGRGKSDENKIAQFKKELMAKMDVYEKILSKQPYMAGQVSRTFLLFKFTDFPIFAIIDIHFG